MSRYYIKCPSRFGEGAVLRPNKIAAGMTKTDARRKKNAPMPEGDALTLQVHGTLATRSPLAYRIKRVKLGRCPCCFADRYGLALNDSGRAYLRGKRADLLARKEA